MSKEHDAPALAKREPSISDADRDAISTAARRLRDQFAIEAFKKLFWNEDGQPPRSDDTRERLARDSWLIADAMMKARGQ